MISEQAGRVVLAIREVVGEQMLGVDLERLIQHDFTKDLDPYDFLAGWAKPGLSAPDPEDISRR